MKKPTNEEYRKSKIKQYFQDKADRATMAPKLQEIAERQRASCENCNPNKCNPKTCNCPCKY